MFKVFRNRMYYLEQSLPLIFQSLNEIGTVITHLLLSGKTSLWALFFFFFLTLAHFGSL